MADIFSKSQRSYVMSQIRSRDTKPEMMVRQYLHAQGFRFRLHSKDLPGRPDIVLPRHATVVQVMGCFWHGHKGCKHFRIPATRTEWWTAKIERNRERDRQSRRELRALGWQVIEVWECRLKKNPEKELEKILGKLGE
jgi:DNA mismatch endonuclease (patch repair protein)